MLIATWNVNSIRSRLNQVGEWLNEVKPDLLCIQETKVEDHLFPKEFFEERGYQVSCYGQKSYNGVALISMHPIEDIKLGLESELSNNSIAKELDQQKRIITALIQGIRVVNVYVPNGSDLASDKYIYKIKWLKCLSNYLQIEAKKDYPICLLGDFNIALEDSDIYNPQRSSGGIMASQLERETLKEALFKSNLKDIFRVFEKGSQHWSWWNYRHSSWEKNNGWRIDHIYLSEELTEISKGCSIHKEVRGNEKPSDHAPVMVDLEWPPNEEEIEEEIDFF